MMYISIWTEYVIIKYGNTYQYSNSSSSEQSIILMYILL